MKCLNKERTQQLCTTYSSYNIFIYTVYFYFFADRISWIAWVDTGFRLSTCQYSEPLPACPFKDVVLYLFLWFFSVISNSSSSPPSTQWCTVKIIFRITSKEKYVRFSPFSGYLLTWISDNLFNGSQSLIGDFHVEKMV